MTLKLRHKRPDGDMSALLEVPLQDERKAFEEASTDFRFAASVAAFAMTLRDSPHKGVADAGKAVEWARASLGEDRSHRRAEFIALVEKAMALPRR